MKVASFYQMKEIDRIAIEECGIEGLSLMENAGRAVSQNAEKMLAGIEETNRSILVKIGKNRDRGAVR